MRTTTLAVSLTAFVLCACDQPVAPTVRTLKADGKHTASVSAGGDALAFRTCYTDWVNYGILQCDLIAQTADGLMDVGSENTSDIGADWHSWSPDGAAIAFVQGDGNWGEIAVMHLADGSITRLTNDAALENSPDWSPDGARIAFLKYDDAMVSADIYVMNASDGGNVTRLTNGIGVQGGPSWSPDGSRIAFTCAGDGGTGDVCAMNADGSALVHLTSGAENDVNPDFSPDGSQIAFVRDGQLRYLTLADGSVSAPATVVYISPFSKPNWSPSGDRIAFSEPISGAVNADRYYDASIVVVNVDGSGMISLYQGSGPGWGPTVAVADAPPVAEFSASCNNLQCYFYNLSTDDHGIVSYHWTFGDGQSDSFSDPGHNFPASGTYDVTLTVGDGKGQTSSVTHAVVVVAVVVVVPDNPPTASFSSSCSARTCAFDSNASSDDHGIVSRTWTFGDGTSATDVVAPSHSYAANGTYTVTLTVTDGKGQQASVSHTATAFDAAPVARFTYTCDNKASCTFDGRSSSDDLGIVSYSWQFGAIGSASGSVATVSFKHNSTQNVTLTVRDTAGQEASTSQIFKVK